MVFRHKLLLALADGQPYELRELYSMVGRQIRPEQAARVYQRENSKYNPEEKLQKGRMRIIVSNLAGLIARGCVKLLTGIELHRTYQITDAGMVKAKLLQQQESGGVLRPVQEGYSARRQSDSVVNEAAKDVTENLRILITDQWTDEAPLFQVSTENVTQATAERAYLYYSRSKVKQRPPDKLLRYGKKILFSRCIQHLHKYVESKMENGKKWIRLRQPEETLS